MIKLDNISFAYKKDFDVLQGVNATFASGVNLLLGPNGAGKTTLLKVIAGLLRPQKGECILGKECTAYHSPHSVREMFLLTDETKFPLASIGEMVDRHAPFYPNFSREFLDGALADFGITTDQKLVDMSLGTRHKANVAYALALGTPVLMLDEPANGLDIPSKQVLTRLIARSMDINPERCIIVATHTVQEMRHLFDSVTVLNHGHVALNASTALINERIAFISDRVPHPKALFISNTLDGAAQIVPNDGNTETPIDYILLFTAATGSSAEALNKLLS